MHTGRPVSRCFLSQSRGENLGLIGPNLGRWVPASVAIRQECGSWGGKRCHEELQAIGMRDEGIWVACGGAPKCGNRLSHLRPVSRCKIGPMSEKLQPETQIETAPQAPERNWLPFAIAGGLVLAVVAVFLVLGRSHGTGLEPQASNAPLDPYAQSLTVSEIAMSEASNLAGGKVTYIDGVLTNTGSRTVTAVTVQALFHSFDQKIAQNQSLALNLIRSREPYIDTEPVSAAPIAPGARAEFRLIFDKVSDDWDGAYPELRILHVETK